VGAIVVSALKRILAALLLIAAAATSPQSLVDEFYRTYIPHKPLGLASGKQLARLKPFLSTKLIASINDALAYQKDYEKKNPGDMPPFIEGDFFSSLFEGPSSFKSGAAVAEGDSWNVPVHFKYENVQWDDVVVVKKENGRYVIDDVIFGGAGEFNPKGRLSERLAARNGG
jgi:uncharacterized protein DUF3828